VYVDTLTGALYLESPGEVAASAAGLSDRTRGGRAQAA
jgi:hypothetical protein